MPMNYDISVSERTFHFKQPAGTSRGVYTTRHSWFLEMTSPQLPQVRGIGECAPLLQLSCDDIPEYERILKDVCGMVCRTGKIDVSMLRPYPSMLFGLETAWQSLHAGGTKLFDTPFGRGEEGIPINGLVWMGTYDEMLARIEEKLRMGFRCIKMKIGAIEFDKEMALIRHIRERYTKEQIELRVDANGGFTPDEALEKLGLLARYDVHSIEQPIRQHRWNDMARLCRESPLPVALDEELIGVNLPAMKEALLDTIKPAFIVLKPSLHGGMYGTEEWIRMARERGIGSWITSALESNVGLNAVAHLAAKLYGPAINLPQGLGTGALFTDNIEMPIAIKGDKLWFSASS